MIKHIIKFSLLLLMTLSLVIIWAVTSSSGADYTLNFLGRFVGLQVQGVSGRLIDQITIQHIELHNKEVDLLADDVTLQWQPQTLLKRHLHLDQLRINSLQLAVISDSNTPSTLPQSLALPELIDRVIADQIVVNQLQWTLLDANKKSNPTQQYSALQARLEIDSKRYQLSLTGVTPWGHAALSGEFASAAPFNTQAQFDWQGFVIQQDDVTLPATQAHGSVSGSWKELLVEAQLNTVLDADQEVQSKPTKPTAGKLRIMLTPFDSLPITALQIDLNSVNPASFYLDAPQADLQIKADFNVIGAAKSPTLQGRVLIKNAMPKVWNLGGIPITQLNSDLTVQAQQVEWNTANIEFNQGGSATTSGQLDWSQTHPVLTTLVALKNVNLIGIDNRLTKTRLSGTMRTETIATGWQWAARLQDAQSALQLVADANLNHEYVVGLQKMELRNRQANNPAKLTAQGSFSLRDKHVFVVEGEASNLNPADWIQVPSGRIATRFHVSGHLQPDWRVEAKVDELSGQFANLNLQGESDLLVEQGKLLSVKKLELNWGKNHLSAKGNWQLSGSKKEAAQKEANQDQLQFKLAVPDLNQLSAPFKKIFPLAGSLQGSLFADGTLSGNTAQPSGQFNINADQLAIPDVIAVEKVQASFALADGAQGKIAGQLNATELVTGTSPADSDDNRSADHFRIKQLQMNLTGLRHAHQLQLIASLPRKNQITVQLQGDLQQQWQGQVQQFNLSGPNNFQLMSPFSLQISSNKLQMGAANWQGNLGKLQVEQMSWSPGRWVTQGQWRGLPVGSVLKLWRNNLAVTGNLQVDAIWQLDTGQQLSGQHGQINIQRTDGDIAVQDVMSGQTYELGLQKLVLNAQVGGAGTNAQQPVQLQLQAQGTQLGVIEVNVRSAIRQSKQGWEVAANAPLAGTAQLSVNDMQWLSQLLGLGVTVGGELQAQAQLAGTIEHPDYSAKIIGKELQVTFTELGVVLPHGVLDASLETYLGNPQFKLNQLRFTQTIQAPPRHDKLTGLPWLNETGFIEASGAIDLGSGRGSITAHWQRFPFLQEPDRWLVASGDAQLTESEKAWNLTGQLRADAAYFSVPKQAPPKLSSDVVVLKKNGKKRSQKAATVQSNVNFNINTGNHFVFVGRGLDTSLMGDLRLRMQNDGPILATGSIQTVGGTYEGYGQQLGIVRGILNFQGALDDPGLNVRAMRQGLPVEAGVEIIGTVAKPEVRLVSEPNVPDQDKLSWMVLGRGSDQLGGSEVSVLMSAASAIFGGDSASNAPRQLAHAFGLDDISVSTVSSSPDSQLPLQTVAGNISNVASSEQVFSVGKRITPDLFFSIERSLVDASNGLKLTWKLTRRISIIGRAGTDTSVDAQYLISFD